MTKLTFLGTGTSQGVPVVSCPCRVCASVDPRDKRLRSSVMVEHAGMRLIIDAGPDFRQQMLRESVKSIDGILLTHEHKDHIGGIDDLRAFNYTSRQAVDVYATQRVQMVIRKDFDYAFAEEKYPGAPQINLVTITGDEAFEVKDVTVTAISGMHYSVPVLGFRIGDVAYLTDFNHIEAAEIEKLKGVEILVVNALRREGHISHFTLSEALRLSSIVAPRRTFLTHISHQMGRHAEALCELPPSTWFAHDGLTVTAGE